MDINVTLFGEMITFSILVWVMMRYIWPPLMKAIQERQQKIAAGLEAAERGQHELETAKLTATEHLHQTKIKANAIVDQAKIEAINIVEESKVNARIEHDKILALGKLELTQEINVAKSELQKQTSDLVIAIAEKILQQKIDATTQNKLIDDLIAKI